VAYIKITNGEQQAYGIGQLRRDNKTVSFPKVVEASTLASYGVYSAVIGAVPSYNSSTQVATQNETATEVDGQWTYEYTVRNKTSEVLAAEVDSVTASARATRNDLLSSSDWTQVSDAPANKSAWASYRVLLRNVPAQSGFPDEITWPDAP
tara:strand:+ start:319 stop:771 length:453 start_codon:yes stop_codon:yes gene_type:complete